MTELITAIEAYSGWLLALVLALIVREIFVLAAALRDRSTAAFGLERESATSRAIRAQVTVLLLATIGFGINSVATIVAPSLPESIRRRAGDGTLVEPTLIAPIATATPTATVVPTPHVPAIVTAVPTAVGSPAMPTAGSALATPSGGTEPPTDGR